MFAKQTVNNKIFVNKITSFHTKAMHSKAIVYFCCCTVRVSAIEFSMSTMTDILKGD